MKAPFKRAYLAWCIECHDVVGADRTRKQTENWGCGANPLHKIEVFKVRPVNPNGTEKKK